MDTLRELGVLHLVPIQPPESDDIDKVRDAHQRAETAAHALRPHALPNGATSSLTAEELIESVHEKLLQRKNLTDKLDALHSEETAIEPMGDFDPQVIREALDKGVAIRLYRRAAKPPTALPEGVVVFPIGGAKGSFFALAGLGEFEFEGDEWPLPSRSLSDAREALRETRNDIEEIEATLRNLAAFLPAIEEHVADLGERVRHLEAQAGMGHEGKLAYLQGFCPEDGVDMLRVRASSEGWGLLIADPLKDEAVPTLVRYPGWVRMMKPVFRFLGIVPGYRESDISSAFLLFLSVFFAMIVGDAGYGVLFLILIPYFKSKKFSDAPPEPFRLLTVFSICTVVWGILTGNYFGIEYDLLPAPLRALRVTWLTTQNNSMTFSLLLGAIHLTLAHGWRAVRFGRDARAIVQIGWIGVVWGVFALARVLLVGAVFPVWLTPVPIAGAVAIVVGLVWSRQWMDMGLLLLDLVSCFGDLMSYLRLFALGIASVKVAEAFNGMAGDMGVGLVGLAGSGPALVAALPAAAVAMASVLALGHGLNIILCAMSVLVHGVRLNALEFSLHMGQEWSGFEYKPFAGRQAIEAA